MNLLHGTTRRRADQILELGPNPRYREPGGLGTEDGFSMCVENGPFHFGKPDEYARGKAREFPDEGGAVILVLEVPDAVVQKSATEWFPIGQGLVQFDPGAGLEELTAAWQDIARTAQIRSVT